MRRIVDEQHGRMRRLPEDRKRPCDEERNYFWNEDVFTGAERKAILEVRDINIMILRSPEMMAIASETDREEPRRPPDEPDGTDNDLVIDNVIQCRGSGFFPNCPTGTERPGLRCLIPYRLLRRRRSDRHGYGGAFMLLRCISNLRRKGQQTSPRSNRSLRTPQENRNAVALELEEDCPLKGSSGPGSPQSGAVSASLRFFARLRFLERAPSRSADR